MEMHLSETNPMTIIGHTLPNTSGYWSRHKLPNIAKYQFEGNEIFKLFLEQYQVIEILRGIPKGGTGVTVYLSKAAAHYIPDHTDTLGYLPVPPHLIGDDSPYSLGEMSGMYLYSSRQTKTFSDEDGLEEEFFFSFKEGFELKGFFDIVNALAPMRQLSNVFHQLTSFKVMLLSNGIYVRMLAQTDNASKPPFMMSLGS
jgi:hypothetical protein